MIVGASVYPNPAFVINILSMDVTFALVDVIATAVAVDPDKPEGDVLNPITVSYTHLTLPTKA